MASRGIEEQLDCPVCFNRFESPRVLPCQHTFCINCVNELLSGGRLQCPECRTFHQEPPCGFPTNITMQRLLDAGNPLNFHIPASSHQIQPIFCTNRPQSTAPTLSTPPSTIREHINHTNDAWTQRGGGRNNQGVHRQYSRPAVGVSIVQPINIREVDNSEESVSTFAIVRQMDSQCFQKCQHAARKVMKRFLKNSRRRMAITICIFVGITISRCVAGAVKLSSDCTKERNVAVYLLVKSIIGFIFWGVMATLGCKKLLIEAMDNLCVHIFVLVETLFSIIWLIIGSVWILENFKAIANECTSIDGDWNPHFRNFALFLTVVDYIGILVVVFYVLYTICDHSEVGNDDIQPR